jgi:hypothetical protein
VARTAKLSKSGELQERIVQMLRAGNYREPVCRAVGISPSSFYNWMQRGELEKNGIYREFHDAVTKAEAEAEVLAVAILSRAMREDWRAVVAYLERRHPSRWRRQTTTELTGKDGGPIHTRLEQPALDLSTLTDEELQVLAKLNARAEQS